VRVALPGPVAPLLTPAVCGAEDFVKTKLMTRLTYTLDGITGDMKIGADGSVALTEKDGIDYAPVTVQLPGGERVPFLFTIKNLAAKGTLASFSGDFNVPSYRGSSFLDPKGRGASTGYDNAVALPARADSEELEKENNKSTKVLKGSAVFNLAKYDPVTGEIAGVFESIQPSDTDLGAKTPKVSAPRGRLRDRRARALTPVCVSRRTSRCRGSSMRSSRPPPRDSDLVARNI